MGTAKAHGMLIEPQDVTAFPLGKANSPTGNEYIGKVEIIDIAGGTNFQSTTYGGVQSTKVVAVGDIIDGPLASIDAPTNITRCRVWWLSAP